MGTVGKALGLLDILAREASPLGLTVVAREAGFDKATTRRLLVELAAHGFVEQDEHTRGYALGAALQALGRIRESRFPLVRVIQPSVRALAAQTEELVHAAEYCAGSLVSICIEQSTQANRVGLDLGQKLPLHSTASGIAFLAASPPHVVDAVARKPLAAFTAKTPTRRDALVRVVREASTRGYAMSNQSMEDGVQSVAAAICDAAGKPVGTLAIAAPAVRMPPRRVVECGTLVRRAADDVSAYLAGKAPALRRRSALEHGGA